VHSLSWLGVLAIAGAGAFAGMINAVVGSGSLVTFPTLVGLGFSPLVANVSNNVGLVFGNLSGIHGYRRLLVGQGERVRSLMPFSLAGGFAGAGLLLWHPKSFHAVVPWLVLGAVGMVVAQPRLARWLAERGPRGHTGGAGLRLGLFLAGVYGGYFGAAQGVVLIAMLSIGLDEGLQRVNALKNVAAMFANLAAGILFIAFAPVNWTVVAVIAISSVLGAQLGARVGRRLPAPVLRGVIVVGGIAVAIHLLL